MKKTGIPRYIQDVLTEGETLLSRLSVSKWFRVTEYCATDKRLLIFKGKSKHEVYEYDKMKIILNKYGAGWAIFRAISILFGLVVIVLGFLTMSPRGTIFGVHYFGGGLDVSIMMWFAGIFLIVAVFVFRYAYYKIDYFGSNSGSPKEFKIERLRYGSRKVDEFADIIKKKTSR